MKSQSIKVSGGPRTLPLRCSRSSSGSGSQKILLWWIRQEAKQIQEGWLWGDRLEGCEL